MIVIVLNGFQVLMNLKDMQSHVFSLQFILYVLEMQLIKKFMVEET